MEEHVPPVLRTTVDDDLFIRMDTALGVPVVNQLIWRLTALPSNDELDRFADRLQSGRVGRLLRRSGVPFARDHWVSAGTASGRRILDATPIGDGGLVEWIDAAASVPFDLVTGSVWELRSAPLASGGAAVSFCVSHAVADGAAALDAIGVALRTTEGVAFAARSPSAVEQARDAAWQAGAIGRNLLGLLRGSLPTRPNTATPKSPAPAVITARTSPVVPIREAAVATDRTLAPVLIVSVATEQWRTAASQAGGSANSLFIAIVLGIVVASGRAGVEDVVRISIPMSLRTSDDDRANATLGLSLDLPASTARDKDLATIRALAKAVYSQRTASPSTFVRLQPLMQALSDRTVARLSRGATTPLALASNLGTIDDHLAGLGDPTRADAVVTRSTTQSISVARLRELRGGLAAWTNDAAGTTTFSVIGLDPDGLGRGDLSRIVRDEFARWSLDPRQW